MHTFDEYQRKCIDTAVYPDVLQNIFYPALGLCGESGEVAELIKKMIRDDSGIMSPERREKLKKELGDVLWYVAMIASEADIMLLDIAQTNLKKLSARMEDGKIQGDGSER